MHEHESDNTGRRERGKKVGVEWWLNLPSLIFLSFWNGRI